MGDLGSAFNQKLVFALFLPLFPLPERSGSHDWVRRYLLFSIPFKSSTLGKVPIQWATLETFFWQS